jgi:hypothetical protein
MVLVEQNMLGNAFHSSPVNSPALLATRAQACGSLLALPIHITPPPVKPPTTGTQPFATFLSHTSRSLRVFTHHSQHAHKPVALYHVIPIHIIAC